jgi:glucuronate isomerase
MKRFMDEDFLLESETAKKLYHGVAEGLPIIDYHCHLNPGEIAGDKRFVNLTDVWLKGDHYKWRAMRIMGVDERLVTGPADDYERFLAWAGTVQQAAGNPLFHWTHLELKRYFGIEDILTEKSAPDIWERANEVLSSPQMGAHGLIEKSNVKVICTTDDPADNLEWHARIKAEGKLTCRVIPTWRPDKALNIASPDFIAYMQTLGSAAGREICVFADLLAALESRMLFFHSLGCRLSDHAFLRLPFRACSQDEAAGVFATAMRGEQVSPIDEERYRTALLLWLGGRYAELGWAMQLHIGAVRNNNSRMYSKLGPDTGYDAVADADLSVNLGALLDAFEKENRLPSIR